MVKKERSKEMKQRGMGFVLGILFLLVVPLVFSGGEPVFGDVQAYALHSPVEAFLDWDGAPGLHRTVTLTVQITSEVDADDLTLR
jgi:hypothetical protein